jgi:diphthamide synthase (EF-2-diphthine--ammonia ligase)
MAPTRIEPIFPLWSRPTGELARQMISDGVRAVLTCVDPAQLSPSFVGRAFDQDLLNDLPSDVDPCGERGEFHTFVWDAPSFRSPIPIQTGEIVTRDGFVFCDVIPAGD